MIKINNKAWEHNGTVYMMADNYGHHSCEGVLYETPSERYHGGRVEPREETRCEEEKVLELISISEQFKAEWFAHCRRCDDFAQECMRDMYS